MLSFVFLAFGQNISKLWKETLNVGLEKKSPISSPGERKGASGNKLGGHRQLLKAIPQGLIIRVSLTLRQGNKGSTEIGTVKQAEG